MLQKYKTESGKWLDFWNHIWRKERPILNVRPIELGHQHIYYTDIYLSDLFVSFVLSIMCHRGGVGGRLKVCDFSLVLIVLILLGVGKFNP